jgi:oxygen-dependent protoporphyrinogen oxidase
MPPRADGGGSMSLRGGLSQIPSRMQSDLPADVLVTGTAVMDIRRSEENYRVLLQDGRELRARAVLLATPAYATASLVSSLDAELARLCETIRYAPASAVALGFKRRDIADQLDGWGFVVPARERGRAVKSASWVSSKWPGRAPGDHALLRLSLDGNVAIDMPDEMLVEWALADLRPLLRVTGAPVLARVYRRARAMPQLEVGHLQKIAAIERRLSANEGLFVSAAGFRGVGLPDCIADAAKTADGVDGWIRTRAA